MIEWLIALLGIEVIKDRQQEARPSVYGMLDLANWRNLGQHAADYDYETLATENSEGFPEVRVTPDIEVEWVFLFMTYGTGCENYMRRLQSAVLISQVVMDLQPDLVIHEVSGANSIPELIGETWEPRAQVNIAVRGKASDGFIVDVIEEHQYNTIGERA